MKTNYGLRHYMTLMNDLAYLGARLDFRLLKFTTHISKNKINHDRQASGY